MTSTIKHIVNKYYKNILFLYLPNICNAKCYFCYLKPSLNGYATLSKNTLRDLKRILLLFGTLNFKEVRITGGEPLVISNLKQIVEIIHDDIKMRYTLLTNGILLNKNMDWILDYPPSKLTISFHSFSNYSKIYGIKGNPYNILQVCEKLLDNNINIVISITFLPENKSEIPNIVKSFYKIGVSEFKIIYPNYRLLGNSLYQDWLNILQELKSYKRDKTLFIRATNFHSKSCMLVKRGFLSLTIPKFNLFRCCVLVNDHQNCVCNIQNIDINSLTTILFKWYDNYTSPTCNYLCRSYISTCPLSLKIL